jgi:iron(III) transport system substrate-binding protein
VRLAEIDAELNGLDRDARRERLIELAQDEGGEINFYGSTNIDDVGPVLDAFEEATEVEVSHYRAGASTVFHRVLEEASAGFAGADVVQINGPEMLLLEEEGLLTPLETPIREDIVEAGRFDTWLAPNLTAYVAAWNTDAVSEEERPTTWQEVLEFDGTLSIDADDFEWFATLTEHYFEGELGMSEEETVELFKEAARNAVPVRGHSIGSQMLVAGEFDVNATVYHHHTTRFPDDAPLEWEPPVEPIIVRPQGVGIMATTSRPATALLLVEFMLTDGQPLLVESGRTPGSTLVDGGLPAGYEVVGVDLVAVDRDREKWEGLFEEIIRETGSEPIE